MIDPSFLDQLRELNLMLKRRVSSAYSGGRPSIQYGRGIEPVDHREYMHGDDFRLVDWKLYGRTERLYIRRFEEEKSMILHLLVDSSASMEFQSDGIRKFDYAGSIAAGLGYLSVHENEKFSTALFSDRITEVMEPSKSEKHLFETIEVMNSIKLAGKTDLATSANQYAKMIKSKSFAVIISDFLEPLDSLRGGIYRMAKASEELMVIQVLDPCELALKWTDDINFEDAEMGSNVRTYLSPNFKKDYRQRVEKHIEGLQGICNNIGVSFNLITTDVPIIDAFVNLIGGIHRGK
ncbi:MAG: DUF58 domain-containing protein [Candidatus Altiarchaeota archaeon]